MDAAHVRQSPAEAQPRENGAATVSAAEWRAKAPLIFACSFGLSLHSVSTYALGLMMDPLEKEFGWGRAQISVVSLIPAVLMVLLSPSTGAIIDRWGSRRLALPSLALTGVALAMISLANGSTIQWWLLWLFYGLVSLGIKATVWTAAITSSFTVGRGMALGLMLTGAALAQIAVPPIAQWLVDDFGWRTAYIGLGIGWSIPAVVLALLYLHDRRHDRAAEAEFGRVEPLTGLSFGAALRNVALIRIAFSTLLTMFIGTAILIHQVPILTATGVTRTNAAWLASFAGVAGIAGKLLTGWMTDRWNAGLVGAITLLAPAVAYPIVMMDGVPTFALILAMAIVGYTTGAKLQITAFLTAQHAGMLHFGKVFGVMMSMIGIGGGLGSVTAGAVYDHFGSYDPLLMAGIAMSVLCSGLLFNLGRPSI